MSLVEEADAPPTVAPARFCPVLVILSPPRCGSTALARAFWRHPAFRWYVHEPYDRAYHRGAGPAAARAALAEPLEVGRPGATGLVVKEMTFQAGAGLADLLRAATLPVVVPVRDPRLAVRSRARQRALAGQPAAFPAVESGWPDLAAALDLMRATAVPYVVVEFTALRRRPAALLPVLCRQLGLGFTPDLLSWPARAGLPLGQLGAEQRHWYDRALSSSRFVADDERPPGPDDVPAPLRPHLAEWLDVYRRAMRDPHAVGPAPAGPSLAGRLP
ncbi:hypothetical protein ACFY2R_18595 [Micromonospora olivasterospora]|uniref:Sulfotransferase family protein n=1 Tax=Micromonospora olivasterospora TaxID=1880 RepID=A0A562I387_MICOL|nr:hypothetical protein [Micromonospora olivasterospora]TWH65115.1 hypothetical protein JD77_00050 [Micromonospora olivasterospora]